MKIIDYIADFFFPPRCIFCRKILERSDICIECEKNLPYTKGDSIVQKFPFIDKCVTPLYYTGTVREAIIRYKFNGKEYYSDRFSQIMADCVENNLDCGDISVISWVPLSKLRQHKRGYNQAKLLAEGIAKSVDLPLAPCLVKTRNNPAQSKTKSAAERSRNVVGVYRLKDKVDVKGKNILLIDDVVTTGSTLSECARILRKAGANKVYCATIARHLD